MTVVCLTTCFFSPVFTMVLVQVLVLVRCTCTSASSTKRKSTWYLYKYQDFSTVQYSTVFLLQCSTSTAQQSVYCTVHCTCTRTVLIVLREHLVLHAYVLLRLLVQYKYHLQYCSWLLQRGYAAFSKLGGAAWPRFASCDGCNLQRVLGKNSLGPKTQSEARSGGTECLGGSAIKTNTALSTNSRISLVYP